MSLGQQYQAQSSWLPTHVQVTVLQARGLRSKGKAGTNDAYAIIQLGKEKYSTTVAEKSHAPLWKEEATFELPLLHQDHRGRGTLRLIIMHRALVGLDKHLGEVSLDLYQLHQERSRRKTQWYKLKSKPGKKEKERGEIELDVQFMRNNMTASMFDLSMKEKSRSPFGKLKDKMKGKRHDGFPDTASAIVPSFTQPGADSDEEGPEKVTKKKSKLKNLFSKPGLQKSPLSQSMLVLPSFQPSPSPLAERKVLRPSDFSSDFNEVPLSTDEPAPKVEGKPPHFPVIMTHKRTVSADPKQINQIVPGNNKKEGLSFFSGLRSKNDPITRSNLCINGNHVYDEETEPKPDIQAKDSTLSFSPKINRKTPIYSSIEDLSTKSSSSESLSSKITKEAVEPPPSLPDKRSSWALSKDSLKSMTLPSFKPSSGEESQEANFVGSSEPTKEAKENKKPESFKSSLLSLVTGKKEVSKDTSKGSEGEAVTQTSVKEEQLKPEAIPPQHSADVPPQHSSVIPATEVPSPKKSLNPFEEDLKQEEKKPEPLPHSTRTPKTTAVKPRLDVSSEAETKAKLFSPSVTGPSHSPSMFLSSNMDEPFASVPALSARRHPTNADHNFTLCSPVDPTNSLPLSSAINLPFPSETLPAKGLSSPSDQLSDGYSLLASKYLTLPSEEDPEAKEVLAVPQFNNQMSSNKTTVRSLLDQLKGKKTDTGGERGGKLERSASGPNPKSLLEKNQELASGKYEINNRFSTSPANHAEGLDFAESNHGKSNAEVIKNVRDIGSSFIPNQKETSIPPDHVQNQADVLPSDLISPKVEGGTPPVKDRALKFEEADDLPNVNLGNDLLVKDLAQNIMPKPMPRTQITSPKVTSDEDSDLPLHSVPTPPKPAPRSVVKSGANTANPIASTMAPVHGPPKPPRALTTSVKDRSSFEHYGPNEKDELDDVFIKDSEMKMASPVLVDLKFRLDELPVIPENPELMSDDDIAPYQTSIPVREPFNAGLSARTVPYSVSEKAANPAKTSVDQKATQEFKQNPHDSKLDKQNHSFKSSRSQRSNIAVDTNENIDFTNEQEPSFNHVQESNALSDLSNNQVNHYPQKADSSADVFPSSISALNSSISLPSNPSCAKEADSPTRPPAVGTDRAESTGKKKLLRAWVSPSETPPIQAPPSAAVPATLRPHAVKPMSTNPVKASSVGTAIKNQENAFKEPKKYDSSDPAASYGQLTHDELIQLVLKQKDTITKKESQVKELEEYIDNLLVRVMEEMPSILVSMAQQGKSGKV